MIERGGVGVRAATVTLCVVLVAFPSEAWPQSLSTSGGAGSLDAEPRVDPMPFEIVSAASLARIRRELSRSSADSSMRVGSCALGTTDGPVEGGWRRDCVDQRGLLTPQTSTASTPNRKADRKVAGAVLLAVGTGLIIAAFKYKSRAQRACESGQLPPRQTIDACWAALFDENIRLKVSALYSGGVLSVVVGGLLMTQ